jgi:hypothetical protein
MMKKIITLSLILALVTASASAQVGSGNRFRKHRIERGFRDGQITRPEKFELRKDEFRTEMLERRIRRDGIVTPFERKRLRKEKCKERREMFRFSHNRRRRLI